MNNKEIRELNIEIHNLIVGINEIFTYELPEEVPVEDLEEIRSGLLEVLETVINVMDKEQ